MFRFEYPTLHVMVGGTGGATGAQSERRYREELCGPDGTRLQRLFPTLNYRPYQLPSFLQWFYVDLNAAEVTQRRAEAVPGGGHEETAAANVTITYDLVPPQLANSWDVCHRLRTSVRPASVIDWLPPRETDPRVGPLQDGAGQFPAVARAVMYETLRSNPAAFFDPLRTAINRISGSGEELEKFGGTLGTTLDVVVSFSLAGGTGSGLYWDVLHLVGHELATHQYAPRIHPLVLLPSAFTDGAGGGRVATLNAAAAARDLYGLTDRQVAHHLRREVGARREGDPHDVHYPGVGRVRLPAETIRTAHLFGHHTGQIPREDLHRGMVARMLAMSSAQPPAAAQTPHQPGHRSQIVNDVEVGHRALSGVGRQTVATSAVASLSIPTDALLDVVAARLVAEGTAALAEPAVAEDNDAEVTAFVRACGLGELLEARGPEVKPRAPADSGYEAVSRALAVRTTSMVTEDVAFREKVRETAKSLAQNLDTAAATDDALRRVDLLRLRRVLRGLDPSLPTPTGRGVSGTLADFSAPVEEPAGAESGPPAPDLPRPRMRRLRFDDPAVRSHLARQDAWLRLRSRRRWHEAWYQTNRIWTGRFTDVLRDVDAVADAFAAHRLGEPDRRADRTRELFRPRVGVTYLLPPGDDRLEGFYLDVRAALAQRFRGPDGTNLPPVPDAGDLLAAALSEAWPSILAAARHRGRLDPERSVTAAVEHVKAVVHGLGVLPRLPDLLRAASGDTTAPARDEDVQQFRGKLAGLIPGDFAPPGSGRLRLTMSYPADAPDPRLERWLAGRLRGVAAAGIPVQWRQTGTETLSVVLDRTHMGVVEVPELRRAIATWWDAEARGRANDHLRWRRRLVAEPGYHLTSEEDRVHLLHRLLCAVWDDRVAVLGDERSPRVVEVDLGTEGAVIRLEPWPVDGLSSWATVLRAYEYWLLHEDERQVLVLAEELAQYNFEALTDEESTRKPAPLFTTLLTIAPGELADVRKHRADPKRADQPRLAMIEDFWRVRTGGPLGADRGLPALLADALDLPFDGGGGRARSLRALLAAIGDDDGDRSW